MPVFQTAYLEARRAAMSQANARLQQTASAAVSALLKVMVDPSTPASVRVRAADCVLARGNQGLENEDLHVRLAALERARGIGQGGRCEGLTFRGIQQVEKHRAADWQAGRGACARPGTGSRAWSAVEFSRAICAPPSFAIREPAVLACRPPDLQLIPPSRASLIFPIWSFSTYGTPQRRPFCGESLVLRDSQW
jgi:hypothetical protein